MSNSIPIDRNRLRLCRFERDGATHAGLYFDRFVVPFGGVDGPGGSDDLLDFLPPDGRSQAVARALFEQVRGLDDAALAERSVPVEQVRLLVPIARPPKLLLLAGNYAKHVEERGGVAAERAETFPYVFMKPPSTTLTHPGDPIVIPRVSPDQIDWECELGVVIGRRCRHVSEADALGCVAGYTVVNDISDRAYRPNPGRKPRERDKHFDWLHGKWHDGSCPLGPCITSAESVPDPQALRVRLSVNGTVRQDATTGQMVFPVAAVIEFLSRLMTLEPGDLISTGTPAGVGSASGTYLKAGDIVEASIDAVGLLRNPVVLEGEGA